LVPNGRIHLTSKSSRASLADCQDVRGGACRARSARRSHCAVADYRTARGTDGAGYLCAHPGCEGAKVLGADSHCYGTARTRTNYVVRPASKGTSGPSSPRPGGRSRQRGKDIFSYFSSWLQHARYGDDVHRMSQALRGRSGRCSGTTPSPIRAHKKPSPSPRPRRLAHRTRSTLSGTSSSPLRALIRSSFTSRQCLVLQPHLVMFEVLSLVVACSGVGLVASSPVGPVVGVCSGV
jgi:hypothetical protein